MDEATVYENSGIALTVKHFLLWFIAPYHSSLVHHTFYIYLPEMYIIKAINQDSSFKFQIQVYLKIKTCYIKKYSCILILLQESRIFRALEGFYKKTWIIFKSFVLTNYPVVTFTIFKFSLNQFCFDSTYIFRTWVLY